MERAWNPMETREGAEDWNIEREEERAVLIGPAFSWFCLIDIVVDGGFTDRLGRTTSS